MLRRISNEGYSGNCAALRDADLRGRLGEIKAPTLVIAGTQDPAATPQDGRDLAAGITGARYVELDTSHLANWEQPAAYTRPAPDFPTEYAHAKNGRTPRRE